MQTVIVALPLLLLTLWAMPAAAQQDLPVSPITVARADLDRDAVPDRLGDTLTVGGRATMRSGLLHTQRLQVPLQNAADTSGLFLFSPSIVDPISRGDSVEVTGVVSQYNGLTQLFVLDYRVLDAPEKTPAATPLTVMQVHGERYEGVLARVRGRVVALDANRGGRFMVLSEPEGSTRNVAVFVADGHVDAPDLARYEVGDQVEVTGVVGQYDYEAPYDTYYQLLPRSAAAIQAVGFTSRFYRQAGYAGAAGLLLALLGVVLLRVQVRRRTRDLAESEDRFRCLAEATFEGIIIHEDDRIADVNHSLTALLGCQADDLVGKRMSVLFAEEDVPAWQQHVRADDGRPTELAVSFGETALLAEIRTRVMIHSGSRIHVTAVRDVTERYEAEQALRQSRHQLQMVVANAPVILSVIDNRGTLMMVEGSALSPFGVDTEELVGQSLFTLAQGLPALLDGFRQAQWGCPAQVEIEAEGRSLEVYLNPVQDDDGEVESVISVAVDITDRKEHERGLVEAKERAEETSRLKSSFLANMSHEIRTPLTAILGFTDLLAEEVSEEQLDLLAPIRQSGQRLMMTLNSVLDLAQLDSGGLNLRPVRVNVAQAAREAVEMFDAQARERGLDFTLKAEASVPALADAGALSRVLNNLLSNAIKFTHDGGVTVVVETEPEQVHIHVEDTGIGLDETFLPNLFREFMQESQGLNRSYEGNGLGLAITKRLVELMDGTITVRSQKEVGSVFTVTLPRPSVETPEGDGRAGASPQVSPALVADDAAGRPQLLIVEDSADSARVATLMLRDYETDVASTPEEALALAERNVYDGLLIDINLRAGQSGIDVLQALRSRSAYASTPAAAVTAYALAGDEDRLLEAGFDAYMSKPYTRRQLLAAVERLLGRVPAQQG